MFKFVVLSVVLAVAAANPISGWGTSLATPLSSSWTAPFTAGLATPFSSPIFTPFVAPYGPVAPIGTPNYRGPLSLAPGQPANILAADGRPLDTLSVNLDRAVHNTAKAIERNGRRLQKRSIVAANNLAAANLAAANLDAANLAAANFDAAHLAATNFAAANIAGARLAGARLAAANLAADNLAAAYLAAGPSATGPLAATSLVASPLTLGRSWVGPAPVSFTAAASIAPFGLEAGAPVGNAW